MLASAARNSVAAILARIRWTLGPYLLNGCGRSGSGTMQATAMMAVCRAPTPVVARRAKRSSFCIGDADWTLTGKRCGDHSQLGLAVQLGTVRLLGTFLPDR
jgi:hypothetical protein